MRGKGKPIRRRLALGLLSISLLCTSTASATTISLADPFGPLAVPTLTKVTLTLDASTSGGTIAWDNEALVQTDVILGIGAEVTTVGLAGITAVAVPLQTGSALGIAADNDDPFDFAGTDSFSVVGGSGSDSDMDMLAAGLGVAPPFAGARADEEEPIAIKDGRTVSVEYTIKLDDGSTAGTNVGHAPLVYQQGAQQALHAFEREIAGMKVDETREFVLSPEEGYGPVNPELRQEVRADRVPEEARREGAQFVSKDRAGNNHRVRVHEVREDTIVLDLNHPLAGKNLHYQVKVVGIE